MTDYLGLLKQWKAINDLVIKITDSKARKYYHDALLLRAINEWGFNPENVGKAVNVVPELTESDKEILNAIKAAIEYKVDILPRTDVFGTMLQFVRCGGEYGDIPKNIQCDALRTAYQKAKDRIHADMLLAADYVINKGAYNDRKN